EPPGVLGAGHVPPLAVLAADVEYATADASLLREDLFFRLGILARVLAYEQRVRILVIDPEQSLVAVLAAAQGVDREGGDKVVVEAETFRLPLRVLRAERVRPGADKVVAEAGGQEQLVLAARPDRLEESGRFPFATTQGESGLVRSGRVGQGGISAHTQ